MTSSTKKNSYVVFPFLKTSGPVNIGKYQFRSTDDTEGLLPEQSANVKEIASMLFLQDNLQIKSAAYSIIPDFNFSDIIINDLKNVQSVVAYFYASPRHEFGDLFLSSGHASMVIFSPGQVHASLVYPDFHTNLVIPKPNLTINDKKEIEGYTVLYNFNHHFWITSGSRVYPPHHITLNRSQDLKNEFEGAKSGRDDYRLLCNLLNRKDNCVYSRTFTAITWFNAANNENYDDSTAIVNLAIAFESLLGLPYDQKTNRLADSISLLLGRIPRLDIWAYQFYDVRSQIVHGGFSNQLRFIAVDSKDKKPGPTYQSLLSYGRRIFQLCLGTLLCGSELSEDAGLKETFYTNEERLQTILKIFSDSKKTIDDRLNAIDAIIGNIHRYLYVPESNLKLETILSVAKIAVKTFKENYDEIPQELKACLESVIKCTIAKKDLKNAEAIYPLVSTVTALRDKMGEYPSFNEKIVGRVTYSIIDLVVHLQTIFYFL